MVGARKAVVGVELEVSKGIPIDVVRHGASGPSAYADSPCRYHLLTVSAERSGCQRARK
jgi:hypothetical protein